MTRYDGLQMAQIALTRFVTQTGAWLDHCRAAERLGLTSVWAGDTPTHDGFAGAALAHAATSRVSVGVAAALPVRSPLQTANAAAELARGGRAAPLVLAAGNALTLGLMHGEPYAPPVERMRDFHACVRAILRGAKDEWIEIETEYAVARGPGLGLDATAVPLLLGATNPRMISLAGQIADGLMVHLLTPRSAIGSRVDAARRRAEGPFLSAAGLLVSVDEVEEVALSRARAELAAALTLPMFGKRIRQAAGDDVQNEVAALLETGDVVGASDALPEACIRELILVTTPERFRSEAESIDVDTVLPVPVGAFLALAEGSLGQPDDPAISQDMLTRALLGDDL